MYIVSHNTLNYTTIYFGNKPDNMFQRRIIIQYNDGNFNKGLTLGFVHVTLLIPPYTGVWYFHVEEG